MNKTRKILIIVQGYQRVKKKQIKFHIIYLKAYAIKAPS
jgi:hypothetical protein